MSLAEQFKAGLRQAKKEQKSDDIVQFMRDNWKLFCSSRKRMDNICEELEQQGQLNPTALSAALDLDERILFKRVKIVDTADAMLNLPKSDLYKTFIGLDRVKNHKEACLIAVAGKFSSVLTDMATVLPEGTVELRMKESDGRYITLFRVGDAARRMPALFTPGD